MSSTIHQTKTLNALIDVTRHINSSLNYQEVAYNCLLSLKNTLELTELCLWSKDQNNPNFLTKKICFSEKEKTINTLGIENNKNPIIQSFLNSITIASPDAKLIEDLDIPLYIQSDIIGFIAVPINLNNHCIGVLSAFRTNFSTMFNEDLLVMKTSASIISQTLKLKGFVDDSTALLKKQNQELKNQLHSKFKIDLFFSQSEVMEKTLAKVHLAANTDAIILLQGESGVGKTAIAKGIHYSSPRKQEPFVVVNCSAIPENLLESELFGYEKGAFTGANKTKKGRFEAALGGTIFLDEIGDIPLSAQLKLLQIIQNNSFERLGSNQTIQSKARIIFATNTDLIAKVKDKTLREDFYYRLMVVPIRIPSLKERLEDIQLLTYHFIQHFSKKYDKKLSLSKAGLNLILEYDWPGNVRELENTIERTIIFSENNSEIQTNAISFLPHSNIEKIPPKITAQTPLETEKNYRKPYERVPLKRDLIEKALQENSGIQTLAAKQLQVSFRQLSYAIKRHKINPKTFKI